MQTIEIGHNQAGQRLDKFLHKYLPLAPMGFLYKMLRKKNITLNGKRAAGSEMLALGDKVCVFFSDDTFGKFSGREVTASGGNEQRSSAAVNQNEEYLAAYKKLQNIIVLYEDDNCLFLDKPVGILTQKAAAADHSLNDWLIGYLLTQNPSLETELATFRPSVCNRLDRNTSGIVLCGKSLPGLQYLSRCIKERKTRKFYRTICVGEIDEPKTVKGYLVKDISENKVRILADRGGTPEENIPGAAFVHMAYVPLAAAGGYTLLEVELITGKSHQIRAQLAHMGHPLIGDTKYGREDINALFRKKYGLKNQLLHACRVEFPEDMPENGVKLAQTVIVSPCPAFFAQVQQAIHL